MNIVIPMAGRGKRFADAGYNKPKPFIDVRGTPMIELAVQNIAPIEWDFNLNQFHPVDYAFTFICLKEFMDKHEYEFRAILKENPFVDNYKIITVDEVTAGAACSVLLAKDIINNNQELIISDCDHLVLDSNHILSGINFFRRRSADGGIWCFLSDSPKWSYLRIRDNIVRQVVEKEVVSNLANTGTYYFRRGSDFVKHAEAMVQNKDTSKGEYYVAPVYNYMITDGSKIIPFTVNQMVGLGTPDDLKAYLDGKV
jgi:dTDP-glucose pyrophosphorylase